MAGHTANRSIKAVASVRPARPFCFPPFRSCINALGGVNVSRLSSWMWQRKLHCKVVKAGEPFVLLQGLSMPPEFKLCCLE